MAASRNTTAKDIQPLRGSIVRRGEAGTTVAAGEIVALQTDAYWDPCNTDGSMDANTQLLGIALNAATSEGDEIDVVMHGPVECLSGATEGAPIYATNTAGEPGESPGTNDVMVGHAETETILYVDPQIIDWTDTS